MLRGVSLTPQQRAVKDLNDLPSELKSSLLAGTTYGSVGGAGASSPTARLISPVSGQGESLPTTTQQRSHKFTGLPHLWGWLTRRYSSDLTGQVPVFDFNGHLTTHQVGVNTFRFRSLSLFYYFRSLSWATLLADSILLYLSIVLLITVVYYGWGIACGAGVNFMASVYFTVVSLAANGGYLGEDEETMTDSTHLCYRGRTLIVMVCSYVNIVFVGIVAALLVSKAEYTGKLGHRIIFSEFCTLTRLPGRVNQWRLTFRMANVDNQIPLSHGQLHLFCVTAEPLREYRYSQLQHRQLLRQLHPEENSSFAAASAGGSGGGGGRGSKEVSTGSASYSPSRAELSSSKRRLLQRSWIASSKKQEHLEDSSKVPKSMIPPSGRPYSPTASSSRPLHLSSTGENREEESGLTRAQRHRRRGRHQGKTGSGQGGGDEEGKRPGRRRGRRSRRVRQQRRSSENSCTDAPRSNSGTSSRSSSRPSNSGGSTASGTAASSSSPSTSAASSRSSSTASSSMARSRETDQKNMSATQLTLQSANRRSVTSDAANSSTASRGIARGYDPLSVVAAVAASEVGEPCGKPTLLPAGIGKSTIAVPVSQSLPHEVKRKKAREEEEEEGSTVERVHLRVQELHWTCVEETYLNRTDSGQLMLWYPVSITHLIDERSPLYRFLTQSAIAAAAVPSVDWGGADTDATAPQRFQLVAVFDATEMESGSTITAKRTYTAEDIASNYKFSSRLVHVDARNGEVMLDFHYFNALLPLDAVESSSTTDSDM